MSGNQPPDDVPPDAQFPAIGDYVIIPGPGDPDYFEEPEPDLLDDPVVEFEEVEDVADENEMEEDAEAADEAGADDLDEPDDEDPEPDDDAGG